MSDSSDYGSSKESSIEEPCACASPGCAHYYITGERVGQEGQIWEAWVCYRSIDSAPATDCDPAPSNDPDKTGVVWVFDGVLRCDLGSNIWHDWVELCRTHDTDPPSEGECPGPK